MVTIERNMLKRVCVKFDYRDEVLKSALSLLFKNCDPEQVKTFWELLSAHGSIYYEGEDGTTLILEARNLKFPAEEFSVTIEVKPQAEQEDEAFIEALSTAYQKLYPMLQAVLSDYLSAARTYSIIRKPLFDAIKSLLKVSSNEDKEVVRR